MYVYVCDECGMKSSASSHEPTHSQTTAAREREGESEIVNLKARHGHCAQGRFLRVAAGFRMAAVTWQHLATSVRVVGAYRVLLARHAPLPLSPSLTVRANQWPGLVLVISHSQVPEVARVVARRTQQRLKLQPPAHPAGSISQQTFAMSPMSIVLHQVLWCDK